MDHLRISLNLSFRARVSEKFLCKLDSFSCQDLALSSRPHVTVFVFSSGFAYRPHGFGENCHQKSIFFKNAGWLLVDVWTDENGGFRIRWCHTSYTTSITHALWKKLSYFHRYNKRKKSPFSKLSVYVWTGLSLSLKVVFGTRISVNNRCINFVDRFKKLLPSAAPAYLELFQS